MRPIIWPFNAKNCLDKDFGPQSLGLFVHNWKVFMEIPHGGHSERILPGQYCNYIETKQLQRSWNQSLKGEGDNFSFFNSNGVVFIQAFDVGVDSVAPNQWIQSLFGRGENGPLRIQVVCEIQQWRRWWTSPLMGWWQGEWLLWVGAS